MLAGWGEDTADPGYGGALVGAELLWDGMRGSAIWRRVTGAACAAESEVAGIDVAAVAGGVALANASPAKWRIVERGGIGGTGGSGEAADAVGTGGVGKPCATRGSPRLLRKRLGGFGPYWRLTR